MSHANNKSLTAFKSEKKLALLLEVKIAITYMHQFNDSLTQIISPAKAKWELQVSGLPGLIV